MGQFATGYAEAHLSELIDKAAAGEEIILSDAKGRPLVRLEPIAKTTERIFGQDAGQVILRDDFDVPMVEFEDLS